MKYPTVILALLTPLTLTGCATYPHVDAAFGHAYTNMVRAQTLDPHDVAHPPALAPAVADGERLENVLKAHRKGVPAGASQSVSAGQFPSTSP